MSGEWTCSGCTRAFSRRDKLVEHRRTCVKIHHQANTPNDPALCPRCGESPRLSSNSSAQWVVGCCGMFGRSSSVRLAVLRWNHNVEGARPRQ